MKTSVFSLQGMKMFKVFTEKEHIFFLFFIVYTPMHASDAKQTCSHGANV